MGQERLDSENAVTQRMASFTVLKLLTAQAIGKRKWKGLIFVTAAISCLGVPWGTALGVLTFLVLTRPSVASRFSNSTEGPVKHLGQRRRRREETLLQT